MDGPNNPDKPYRAQYGSLRQHTPKFHEWCAGRWPLMHARRAAEGVNLVIGTFLTHTMRHGWLLIHSYRQHYNDTIAYRLSRRDLTRGTSRTRKKQTHPKHIMKLKPGIHLIIACNDKGGASKSTAIAEIRTACVIENLPCRLVTFDRSNQTLQQIFRGEGVHVLAKPNGDILLESLGQQIDQARENGEIIIADMPPGITDSENPIMRAFSDSNILEEFATIGLIIPITTDHDHIKGALASLKAYAEVPIHYDRGLIRAWRPEPTSPTWDSFSSYSKLNKLFPFWECSSYMQSMADMLQGNPPFADYPALDRLPNMYAEKGATLSTTQRGKLRAAVVHLENAREAIYKHLLKPIMESCKAETNP